MIEFDPERIAREARKEQERAHSEWVLTRYLRIYRGLLGSLDPKAAFAALEATLAADVNPIHGAEVDECAREVASALACAIHRLAKAAGWL